MIKNKNINSVLNEILVKIEPPKKEMNEMKSCIKEFIREFGKNISKLKISAEIFIGGSFAKNTVIKKDCYDADIFVRFDKKYKDDEISKITFKALKNIKNVSVIHGSRDYFRVMINPFFSLEIIPVIKVKNPKEARNITDLSYSHVRYIKRKIKSKKSLGDIKIAKAFCYANKCYGAESYIRGFSGYAIELLVYYYGGFLKFVKAMSVAKEKIVIDIEKDFKNKQNVLMDLNSAKLQSPIILIDPTFKNRNALAALSKETFEKFKRECQRFLKNPSTASFEVKKTDLNKIKKYSSRKGFEFVLMEAETGKQEGDIAGSKLLKFYKHLEKEIEKFFDIKNCGFDYKGGHSAGYFFAVKTKKEILFKGPGLKDEKNVKRFKKEHRSTFVKSGRIYAREKIKFSILEFIGFWRKKNKNRMKEMSVDELRVI